MAATKPLAKTPGASETTRTVVTILLLLLLTPVGIIVMWFWTHWEKWIKIVITVLFVLLFFILLPVLAVLAATVLITINPAGQLAQANNTQRRADVVMILQSLDRYKADHQEQLPQGLTNDGAPKNIAVNETGPDFCKALVPMYAAALPKDPETGTFESCDNYDTKYTISVSPEGQITVSAPGAEIDAQISVTK